MSQVYFLYAPTVNLLKIGRSADPARRFEELRLLSPVPLEVIGVIDGDAVVEGGLHHRFNHLWAHGEWFHATDELKDFAHFETLKCIWNRAGPAVHARFREEIDGIPAFLDRRSAA